MSNNASIVGSLSFLQVFYYRSGSPKSNGGLCEPTRLFPGNEMSEPVKPGVVHCR
jgi:hypothetical protein